MMQKIRLDQLIEWKKNPRKITRYALERLCRSIKRHPEMIEARPLLVNKTEDGMIVYGGNQRMKAMKELGWTEAPCSVDENLSEEIMNERAMIDNVQFGELVIDKVPDLKLDDQFLEIIDLKIGALEDSEKYGEVEFTKELMEENNYIVLVFDNVMDWKSAETAFGLGQRQALDSKHGFRKIGIGRVVDGKEILEILLNKNENHNS